MEGSVLINQMTTHHDTQESEKKHIYQMTIDELKHKFNNETLELLDVTGIFEIHLIVHPDDQVKLFAFSLENDILADKSYLNMKTTCALSFYGSKPNQPMLTFWISNANSKFTLKKTLELVEKMEQYGLDVQRLKIEAMAKDVPEMNMNESSRTNYFEFHFKVDINSSKQQWDRLNQICLPFGAHLFFNPYSKLPSRMIPVVTLRRYDMDFQSANDQCNELIKAIEYEKFTIIEGKVQRELSVIDTNVFYDQGWLFKDDPREFITC